MAEAVRLERAGEAAAARLPALLTEADRVAGTLAVGSHGRRRPGAGETFWQYRDYAFGDAASSIDWRQSARVPGRYFVRQTEWETAASVHVWAGGGDSMDYASGEVTKRWRARVLATALAALLARGGERVGPMDGPARSGRTAVTRLAERLLSSDGGALPLMAPERATRVVLISDFHERTEDVLASFAALRGAARPVHVVQVSDPAEVSFPYAGRTVFRSPSGAERREYGEAGGVRDRYAATREAHLGALSDACASRGWTFLRHVTDAPVAPVLASLHAAMAQARPGR